MTILTRRERERLVIELYNQGKTYREIAKEARISPRDIGVILNKIVKEQKTEGTKEEEQQEVEHVSLSTQSYKLFSDRKTPLEVAIELNLRESEATKFYREYWKLKQLHNLNMVYEEIKDDLESFLKFYKLARAEGMDVEQIVNLLKTANNDLPVIEERSKALRNDVSTLQSRKHICERSLYQLNNQIVTSSHLLNSFHISCKRKRSEIENLYKEKAILEVTVTEFKSNNKEYLKVKQVAEDKVKSVLTNGKILLKFATASVIESLRRNQELYNFVLNDISSNDDANITSRGSNYLSLTLPGQQQQPFGYMSDDPYTAAILEESEKLYNELTTKLINEAMAAAAAMKTGEKYFKFPNATTNTSTTTINPKDYILPQVNITKNASASFILPYSSSEEEEDLVERLSWASR